MTYLMSIRTSWTVLKEVLQWVLPMVSSWIRTTRSVHSSGLILLANSGQVCGLAELSEQDRRLMIGQAEDILQDQEYVSVQLTGGDQGCGGSRTVVLHVRRRRRLDHGASGPISIHVTSEDFVKGGARYRDLDSNSFPSDLLLNESSATLEDMDVGHVATLLEKARDEISRRLVGPTVLQFDIQGYHERQQKAPYTGTDTGGQTAYCETQSVELAKLGFMVTIVNRGGPRHPITRDSRIGTHYYLDGVDLLFTLDDRPDQFICKEDMYPQYDLNVRDEDGHAVVKREGLFKKLAEGVARSLRNRKIHTLVGHYIDGAAVAREFYYIRKMEGQEVVCPKIAAVVHSLGALKRYKLAKATGGAPIDPFHNLDNRIETEMRVFSDPNVVLFDVSLEIEECILSDYYGARRVRDVFLKLVGQLPEIGGSLPAGIDRSLFHPLDPETSRTDSAYDSIWVRLTECMVDNQLMRRRSQVDTRKGPARELPSKVDLPMRRQMYGHLIREIQRSKIVFEAGRTVDTKGKDVVLRAFSLMKQRSAKKLKLVMNIADPCPGSMEGNHAKELITLIQSLGLDKDVIHTPSFSSREVALILQIADVYMTASKMETWGMSVQEAAASRLPIVSSQAVPIANGPLRGLKCQVKETLDGTSSYTLGEGVVLFHPSCAGAAAEGALYILSDENRAVRSRMKDYAYGVAGQYNWSALTKEMMETLGFQFCHKS